MREPVTAYIGLGANLGDAVRAIHDAFEALAKLPGTRAARLSRIYRSAPVDAAGPDYHNAVAELLTGLAPLELLDAMQAIENAAGRERPYRHAPRTMDLDLLFHGDAAIATPRLTLPHPRWRERAFVLMPLAELAPHLVTRQDLQRVAAQRTEPLPPTSLPR
jgi:2-amino-4-hydroxy-6-hydroxymethyldihydropteridine diphosphokinase